MLVTVTNQCGTNKTTTKTAASASCLASSATATAAAVSGWGWGRWAPVRGVGRRAQPCWGWAGTSASGTAP